MPLTVRRIMAVMVAVFCIVGVVASVQRSRDVLAWPDRGTPSPIVQQQVEQTAVLMGVPKGSPDYGVLETTTVTGLQKFHDHPLATLLHLVPGALVLAMAPLQFSPWIRRRWPAVHRWSGRFLMSVVILAALTGFFFGFATPLGGALEASAVAVFGALFLFAAARGWIAIRRGDRVRHREWMIRMFAVALGIAVVRVGMFVAIAATGAGPAALTPQAFAMALWVGWLVTLAAAELWIRATRALPVPA